MSKREERIPAEIRRTVRMPDGLDLQYHVTRSEKSHGSRSAVVLLHGIASNHTRWSEFLEHTSIRGSIDIVRFDLRGHQENLVRGGLGMEVWARDIVAIMDDSGYEKVVLAGHSLGANIAVHFAARYPENVLGLVLVDPVHPDTVKGSGKVAKRMRYLLALSARVGSALNRLGFKRSQVPSRDMRALDEDVRGRLLASGDKEAFIKQYSSLRADLAYFPAANYAWEFSEIIRPLPRLSACTFPVLLILASGGTYGNTSATEQAFRSVLRSHKTVHVPAHHWPLTETPEETRTAIDNWLKEVILNIE